MDKIAIIYLLICIVSLVCFFYMCNNIYLIRKQLFVQLRDPKVSLKLYYKYKSYKDYATAKIHLQDYIWDILEYHQLNLNGSDNSLEVRKNRYEEVKKTYEILFTDIGEDFPKLLDLESDHIVDQ